MTAIPNTPSTVPKTECHSLLWSSRPEAFRCGRRGAIVGTSGWLQSFLYLPLLLLAILMLSPFVWMLVVALMKPGNALKFRFIPEGPLSTLYSFENFERCVMSPDFPFLRFFANSLIVAGISGLLVTLICTVGGYAFAKKRFLGRELLFKILLASMLVPGLIYMIPQLTLVIRLGWVNSWYGLIVPHLASVFGLFLMRQHIATIPDSLFEAAHMDGAGEAGILRYVVFPLSIPAMVTLFLLTFLFQWSNFLWQLVVNTPDSPLRTLPVGLALFKGQYAIQWEMMMAGACFSVLPIALLFLLAQRFFIEGLTQGAVKG